MIRVHFRPMLLGAFLLAAAMLAPLLGSPHSDAGDAPKPALVLTDGGQFVFWELGPTQAGRVFQTVVIAWLFDSTAVSWTSFIPALGTRPFALADGAMLWVVAEGAQTIALDLEPDERSVARQWNEELLAAIRLDFPAPTVHARNLFHLSVAMYDAWAAYDPTASGYLVQEKVPTTGMTAAAIQAAREEAISYAAYRLLRSRFANTISAAATRQALNARMSTLGYDRTFNETTHDEESMSYHTSASALGNRIAATVIAQTLQDGSNEANGYVPPAGYEPVNDPLVLDLRGTEMNDPNRWQPLAFDFFVTQNGIAIGELIQEFTGPHWGEVTAFALQPDADDLPWRTVDPGPPPYLGGEGDGEFRAGVLTVIRLSGLLSPDDGAMVDQSPAVAGNRPLGTHDDHGHAVNPVTGEPYTPNPMLRADYGRVIAEFWADGPDSETPPGHWNVLANEISEDPRLVKQLEGTGSVLDNLEWDVKLYLALNGALHDAAIAAWGSKGAYDYSRPISMIRYMGGLGQSSDPEGPSFHADGLPLEPSLVEVISAESTLPGARHAHLAGEEGEIAIQAWSPGGEEGAGSAGWILATEWVPYQAPTFVTPPFAAYVSGHSTFSRAGAEVLTLFTGSAFFPGGLGEHTVPANTFLAFDEGPSETITLQWATYSDAADEAGISRLYGGIHVPADDFPGRIIGSQLGQNAFALALQFFAGQTPG
jgi:hypothetical protein